MILQQSYKTIQKNNMTTEKNSQKRYIIQAIGVIILGIALAIFGSQLYHGYTGKYIAGDNTKQSVFFAIVIGFTSTMFLLLILHNILPSSWYCKSFGWHRKKDVAMVSHDGASYHGHCNRCNKDVLQDSNGDWFA